MHLLAETVTTRSLLFTYLLSRTRIYCHRKMFLDWGLLTFWYSSVIFRRKQITLVIADSLLLNDQNYIEKIMNSMTISAVRPKTSILDRSLSKGRGEVNLSCYALLFSELVQYCQNKVYTVPELQNKLVFKSYYCMNTIFFKVVIFFYFFVLVVRLY